MRAEKAGGRISERMSDAQGCSKGRHFFLAILHQKNDRQGLARGDIKEDIVFEIQRFLNDYLSS